MKDKIKRILLINLFFLILPLKLSSNDLIIPQKKPIISEDIVKISKVKNYLIPLKKPQIKEKKEVKISKILENNTKKKVNGIILPISKPIIVKKDKLFAQKKSKYFNEKDYYVTRGGTGIDFRAKNIESFDNLEENAIDFYASVKSLYLQDRRKKILNSKGIVNAMDDSDWEEIEQ